MVYLLKLILNHIAYHMKLSKSLERIIESELRY